MIKATVMRTVWLSGATDYTVKAEGHAGAGKWGSDIVCAAVSCLMQTLANKVEEAARREVLKLGSVAHGDGWMKVEVQPTGGTAEMVDAWVEFVQDGLDAIAQSYPENVELEEHTVFADGKAPDPELLPDVDEGKLNLQLFAEGAGADGTDGGEGTENAPAAPVQEPALRPAQERLARRSGALKGKETLSARNQPAAELLAAPPKGEPSAEEELPEKPAQEPGKEEKQQTPEQRRHAFGEMMQGEYKDLFAEAVQHIVEETERRLRADPKQTALTAALSEAYGVDASDMDGLIDAVKNGRVKDDAYYENLAQERGVSVKTARELDKMESDLRRANDQNAKLQAMRQEAERQQRAAQIRAQWDAQAEQLKAQYPDFDLQEVLDNPQVAKLMRMGCSMPEAYRAAYFDHIMEQNEARTAQRVEQGVAARIQQRASRPGENGTRPGGAVTTHVDISNTTRRQREELERRARRGEKIVL